LPPDVVDIRCLLASVYSNADRQQEAEAELNECLKLDPENVVVNNDLGYLWADMNKNLAEAELLIRKAIELDRRSRQTMPSATPVPAKESHDNACYIDSLGWVLFRRGQLEDARKELEAAVALLDGDDGAVWDHLGDVCCALGDGEGALAAWEKALHFYAKAKGHKMDERRRALREKVQSHQMNHVKEPSCQVIPTGQPSGIKRAP
jgi:Flp pilus assembly protein TadD